MFDSIFTRTVAMDFDNDSAHNNKSEQLELNKFPKRANPLFEESDDAASDSGAHGMFKARNS